MATEFSNNNATIALENEGDNNVNVGVQNWRALRADWNKRPDDWKPKPKKKIDKDKLMEEITKGGSLSERVPLTVFIRALNEIWETDGVI